MDQKLHKKIQDRREKGTLRSLSSFDGMMDFVSNDYLGLANIAPNSNHSIGATGSRLISGNSLEIDKVETALAAFFESPAALCFNSGYDANLGVFSSIPQKGDVVLYDADIHASVRDGIRLSNAESFSFKHNNLEDLERLLRKCNEKTVYVAVEGLYSMGGDVAPIGRISKLTQKYNAYLIIDEAHSGGVFGDHGKGITHAFKCIESCLIRVVTFGKAYGGHGAVVLCSQNVREYLINFSRSFIYTTALPESAYIAMLSSVQTKEINARRKQLQDNLQLFRSKMNEQHLFSEVNSPIQIVRGFDVSKLRLIQSSAEEKGIALKLVYPPTVKKGDECIRICIHSFNTTFEIGELVSLLNDWELE